MALRLVTPAPLAGVASMTFHTGVPASVAKFAGDPMTVAAILLKRGPSYAAIDEGGDAIAAGGYVPLSPDLFEGWFLCRQHAGVRILSIVRLAQLTLPPLAQDGQVTVAARVAIGWRPGRRIAALLGMTQQRLGMGYEIWERTIWPAQ